MYTVQQTVKTTKGEYIHTNWEAPSPQAVLNQLEEFVLANMNVVIKIPPPKPEGNEFLCVGTIMVGLRYTRQHFGVSILGLEGGPANETIDSFSATIRIKE